MTTGAEGLPRPTRKQRVAAWVASGAARSRESSTSRSLRSAAWDVVMVSIAALATLVVAAWFALSRRGRARVLAVAVAAVALVVFTVVLWSARRCSCSWWPCCWLRRAPQRRVSLSARPQHRRRREPRPRGRVTPC